MKNRNANFVTAIRKAFGISGEQIAPEVSDSIIPTFSLQQPEQLKIQHSEDTSDTPSDMLVCPQGKSYRVIGVNLHVETGTFDSGYLQIISGSGTPRYLANLYRHGTTGKEHNPSFDKDIVLQQGDVLFCDAALSGGTYAWELDFVYMESDA